MDKLENVLGGIKNMKSQPAAVFIVDPNREHITVKEAKKLKVPLVAIVDTNCDPTDIDYIIPGNDDAIRAIKLFASKFADAVLEGKKNLKRKWSPNPIKKRRRLRQKTRMQNRIFPKASRWKTLHLNRLISSSFSLLSTKEYAGIEF